ncbi:hypothetical protein ES702_05795 [subsurface metagenome]
MLSLTSKCCDLLVGVLAKPRLLPCNGGKIRYQGYPQELSLFASLTFGLFTAWSNHTTPQRVQSGSDSLKNWVIKHHLPLRPIGIIPSKYDNDKRNLRGFWSYWCYKPIIPLIIERMSLFCWKSTTQWLQLITGNFSLGRRFSFKTLNFLTYVIAEIIFLCLYVRPL